MFASVPAEAWMQPHAHGKWTYAELMQHLTLTYDVLSQELEGGPAMSVRTAWWQRILLNLTVRPRIIRGGGFPRGAPAPREVRPKTVTADPGEAALIFAAARARFERAVAAARADNPGMRITHAYFGRRPLEEALRFCAAHLRHHQAQMSASMVARTSHS
ncbi:MAG: DinB family protein [Chloroflexi bacterium]|nr:DinB family protein [Chloroflexota bacterium]